MILSPDGHVRTFDEEAAGTVFSEGVAAVVLKRLSDAINDGDTVHAVIKAVALNNDGAEKVSYASPSIDGQAEVVALAQQLAEVSAYSIGYIEAHGTGTYVGDPVEIAALTQAFRQTTQRTQFCAVGSVKTNVGHQDVAAGITGLIKAALCVRDGVIAPSLRASARIDKPTLKAVRSLSRESFARLACGRGIKQPRRAGVSSFGIGGTNARHVEQARMKTTIQRQRGDAMPRLATAAVVSAR